MPASEYDGRKPEPPYESVDSTVERLAQQVSILRTALEDVVAQRKSWKGWNEDGLDIRKAVYALEATKDLE